MPGANKLAWIAPHRAMALNRGRKPACHVKTERSFYG